MRLRMLHTAAVRRRGVVAVGVVSAFLIAGGITFGSIPDAGGVIHGCYAKRDGTLRVIDTNAGASCSATKETAVNWNQTGQPGADGLPGSPGPGATTFEATGSDLFFTRLATATDSGIIVDAQCDGDFGLIRIRTMDQGDRLEVWGTSFSNATGLVEVVPPLGNAVQTGGLRAGIYVIARALQPGVPFTRIDVGGELCTFAGMVTPSN